MDVEKLFEEAITQINVASTIGEIREVEVAWLGKKGRVTMALKRLGEVPPDARPEMGRALNFLKQRLEDSIAKRRKEIEQAEIEARVRQEVTDLTIPGVPVLCGHLHPLSQVLEEVEDIFERMGYYVMDFYEVEDDFHNFEALNIPPDHPARDLQDTFYLDNGFLLRTHTSPGQIRAMRTLPKPFRAVFPGRVYRFEATDASHEHTFHQLEGLMIDRSVSVANLISAMMTMLEGVFGRKVEVRLRPGYFPFVEPGFELDVRCLVCEGAGCPMCKRTGWVEFLGCGLVHPNVIRAGGLDPAHWEGWAFGVGLSRLVLLRYGIEDIRLLMSGDLRFTRQF